MYINRHNKLTKQFGFSLWELSIVMLIMIGLFVALVNIMPYIVKRENVEVDKSILVKIDEQLLGFIATYDRLPCPDTDLVRDGLENCNAGNDSGAIPYKDLGLNEDYAGIGSIPIQYAVYRNSASFADLANVTNVFNPTDSHGTVTVSAPEIINTLDFCSAITNAKNSTFSSTFAHVILPDGTTNRPVPYVLVTAGLSDLDGDNSPFDGQNSNSTLAFEAANKPHTATYDDTVFTKSFDELASSINCDTAQNSLNLLADAKATHEENLAQADNLKANAELAAIILGAQILLGIANTAMAAFTLAAAVTTLATASSLLAGAIASCIVLVGCALIPVYTAGVVASVVAIVAGGISVGLNVAALITQAVALGLVIDVALRAGAQISLPESSSDDSGTPVTNEDLAAQIRADAERLKADAAQKVINARNTINNAIGRTQSIRDQISTLRTQSLALRNTTGVINDATFTSYANATYNQANTNLTQANTAVNNTIAARNDANNAVTALGTPVFVFPNLTYPNVDYATAVSHLELADAKMTVASDNFTNLRATYTNIRTQATNAKNRIIALKNADPYPAPADPFNPTAAEITAINQWNIRRANYDDAQNKAQIVINQMNATRTVFISEIYDRLSDAIEARDNIIEIIGDLAPLLDPPAPTQAQLDERAALVASLNDSLTEQNNLIVYYNNVINNTPGLFFEINRLQDDIQIAFGNIEGSQASTEEAYETIEAAIEAEENATYFENNVGNGLPNPNGTLLEQAGGVDDILRAADLKGAEQ